MIGMVEQTLDTTPKTVFNNEATMFTDEEWHSIDSLPNDEDKLNAVLARVGEVISQDGAGAKIYNGLTIAKGLSEKSDHGKDTYAEFRNQNQHVIHAINEARSHGHDFFTGKTLSQLISSLAAGDGTVGSGGTEPAPGAPSGVSDSPPPPPTETPEQRLGRIAAELTGYRELLQKQDQTTAEMRALQSTMAQLVALLGKTPDAVPRAPAAPTAPAIPPSPRVPGPAPLGAPAPAEPLYAPGSRQQQVFEAIMKSLGALDPLARETFDNIVNAFPYKAVPEGATPDVRAQIEAENERGTRAIAILGERSFKIFDHGRQTSDEQIVKVVAESLLRRQEGLRVQERADLGAITIRAALGGSAATWAALGTLGSITAVAAIPLAAAGAAGGVVSYFVQRRGEYKNLIGEGKGLLARYPRHNNFVHQNYSSFP
jgi:hypothetical protein